MHFEGLNTVVNMKATTVIKLDLLDIDAGPYSRLLRF